MSLTKYFPSLSRSLIQLVFELSWLLLSSYPAISEHSLDIPQIFHLRFGKKRIFHLFFCCSVIKLYNNFIERWCECLLSTEDSQRMNEWTRKKVVVGEVVEWISLSAALFRSLLAIFTHTTVVRHRKRFGKTLFLSLSYFLEKALISRSYVTTLQLKIEKIGDGEDDDKVKIKVIALLACCNLRAWFSGLPSRSLILSFFLHFVPNQTNSSK